MDVISQARRLLQQARHVVVFTGAGISTPSGIPDFRSHRTGLWEQQDPMRVASLSTFQRQPEVFYDWLRPLAAAIWQASPNPAHIALARLQTTGRIKAIITQNIDGLHQRAGANHVIEVHGSLNTFTCPACHSCQPYQSIKNALIQESGLPTCPLCHACLKPDITLFEEMLPETAWEQAIWHSQQADLFIVAGSSLEVTPANYLPALALKHGAQLMINNLSSTHLDRSAVLCLPDNVINIIPALLED